MDISGDTVVQVRSAKLEAPTARRIFFPDLRPKADLGSSIGLGERRAFRPVGALRRRHARSSHD